MGNRYGLQGDMAVALIADLVLKKHFLLILALLNILYKTVTDFFQVSRINRNKSFVTFLNAFTVTFDQFNASLLNKSIKSFQKSCWPQTFKQ